MCVQACYSLHAAAAVVAVLMSAMMECTQHAQSRVADDERGCGAMDAKAEAPSTKTPPPPSEAFPAVVPRINQPAKRGDHKPTRSSPLAAKPPTAAAAAAEDPDVVYEPLDLDSMDEIARMELLTAKRAEALAAMEEQVNEYEKHIRATIAGVHKTVNESNAAHLGKLSALGLIIDKERGLTEEAKERALKERRTLIDMHVDQATAETEAMARVLEEKVAAVMATMSQEQRRSHPLFISLIVAVLAALAAGVASQWQ